MSFRRKIAVMAMCSRCPVHERSLYLTAETPTDVMSSLPAPSSELSVQSHVVAQKIQTARDSIAVLVVVPTLDVGAAGAGAVELVRILASGGFRAIVVSRAGRLVADITAAGAEFVPLDVSSNNPLLMLRNAIK